MHSALTPLDTEVTEWLVGNRAEPWTGVARTVTLLGNTLTLAVVAVLVTLIFFLRGDRRAAAAVGLGTALGYALMVALKELFDRDRPPITDRLLDIDTHSFPSGHAMMSTVVYGLTAVACYRTFGSVRRHAYVLLVVPLLALVIGLTRVYLGVHWFTDVLAGWLIGALVVAVGAWFLGRVQPRADQNSTRGRN